MRVSREWLLLAGSLVIIAALYNHYIGGHSAYALEIAFLIVGAFIALLSLKGTPAETLQEDGLLIIFLSRFITKRQCATFLPLAGFALILAWSVWKIVVVSDTSLRMNDFIVTLLGLSLVLYYAGPSKLTKQKDFIVLYLIFLAVVFVVIWNLYTIITGESYSRVTTYAEYYFITTPVVFLLRMLGIDANSELDLSGYGLSNIIEYEYQGRLLRLGIGSGCSGLYSSGLFFSAFLAFVLVRYRRLDLHILVALGIGFAVTWVSNILRMVITVIVGSMYGHPALAFVHSYIGILIFLTFITVFWLIIVRWLDRVEFRKGAVPSEEAAPATGQPTESPGTFLPESEH